MEGMPERKFNNVIDLEKARQSARKEGRVKAKNYPPDKTEYVSLGKARQEKGLDKEIKKLEQKISELERISDRLEKDYTAALAIKNEEERIKQSGQIFENMMMINSEIVRIKGLVIGARDGARLIDRQSEGSEKAFDGDKKSDKNDWENLDRQIEELKTMLAEKKQLEKSTKEKYEMSVEPSMREHFFRNLQGLRGEIRYIEDLIEEAAHLKELDSKI